MKKQVSAPVKGQQSLFSFFGKGNSNIGNGSAVSSNGSNIKDDNAVAQHASSSNVPLAAKTPFNEKKTANISSCSTGGTSIASETPNSELSFTAQKRSRTAVDDEENDNVNKKIVKKSNKIVDDDELWDDNWDKKVESDNDGDDYEDEDEDDDEESEGDDDLVDTDESDDEKPKKRTRPQKSKAPSKKSKDLPPLPPKSAKKNIAISTPVATKMNMIFEDNVTSNSATKNEDKAKPAIVLPEGVVGLGSHLHNSFQFLQPSQRQDAARRRPDHPDYNPRTLYVPANYLDKETPAMKQWWQLKMMNMDTVLFFKVGKFYELFHMDADVGMSELDLIYMKGDKAHSGFPEVSYGKFASILVSKGYKVARVEQTETPEMMADRNAKTSGKKEKVVAREMCSIISKGTRTMCHLDDLSLLENDNSQSLSVLMCIKESESNGIPEYGVCCIDTVIGTVTLGQFQDEPQRSRLRTMISKYVPSEVLLENGGFSEQTKGVVRLLAPKASLELLRGNEMPSADITIKQIKDGQYFGEKGNEDNWPILVKAIAAGVSDGSSALVTSALGGALWMLRRSIIDYEVLSLGKFFAYVPSDEYESVEHGGDEIFYTPEVTRAMAAASDVNMDVDSNPRLPIISESNEPTIMTLDAVALQNLEILVNNFDKTEKGSLWAFINRCQTPFGRRQLKDWLCHPLFRIEDIRRRSAAVEQLLSNFNNEANIARVHLKGVPDLERLLSRVHSTGLNKKSRNHPDSRAVMYEMTNYNIRKVKDFGATLEGFEKVLKIHEVFSNHKIEESDLLRMLVKSPSEGGKFPYQEMASLLKLFRELFDYKEAVKEGIIKPRPGVDNDYDQAREDITNTHSALEEHLRAMKRKTGINDIKFFGAKGKDRFQIEVPMGQCSRVPADWSTKSQKKTHRRYWTPEIEKLYDQLANAEDRLAVAQTDTLRKVFERFDGSRGIWTTALKCVSLLDALLSLASVSSSQGYVWPEMCRRSEVGGPKLDIQQGRHPMLEYALESRGDGEYIPNSLSLGGISKVQTYHNMTQEEKDVYIPRLLLLSGPNMGGKSTLLRQTCLITILAQIGCKVPAESCSMTPVDRIFTRVGASDRILAGQSTFFVELAETAIMLQSATQDSLGILDELGRGTATFDGTAIAHSVVEYLVKRTKCRTLFATHYHSLIHDWDMDPRVKLGHMDCLVDSEKSDSVENVTFLYHLADGSSPRSYGINVAKLARLPEEVIAMAVEQSKNFEEKLKAFSSKENSLANGTLNISNYNVVSAFYDRVMSIVESNMDPNEFSYVIAEIWTRFQSSL